MIPIHLRNPDDAGEKFDHPGMIEFFCRWYLPKIYLEYGTRTCRTISKVAPFCEKVIGVDIYRDTNVDLIPNMEFYQMTTSSFKSVMETQKLVVDIAFIDADHNSTAVFNDFCDIFPHLIENGLIFLHDTFPIEEKYQHPGHCNDAWKVPLLIKSRFSNACELITIPIQPGLSIVRKTTGHLPHLSPDKIDFTLFSEREIVMSGNPSTYPAVSV